MRRIAAASFVILAVIGLLALGVWQVQRLAWKTALIARVDARVHAAPQPAPGPENWPAITAEHDEYRHVTLRGHFLGDAASQVYTLSDYGAGYWIMTPLQRDDGALVYINRGFVPLEQSAAPPPSGDVTVTGLLRLPETKGWLFSQPNDPPHDLWYRRDTPAMAARHGLVTIAPYFIDADTTLNSDGWPKGGLTRVVFPNSHLMYALTWFTLAALLAGASIWLTWFRKPDDDA